MKLFSPIYDWMLRASRHPHASAYLAAVSVAEASFFPIPPDIMLAPMTLARPQAWWRLALLTTLASVAGGVLGYAIGHFLFDLIAPLIERWGYQAAYDTSVDWFSRYGFWAILAAGFTPIPFKVFTIAAGTVQMALLPFVLGALVGRGARFFLVAALVRTVGPRIEPHLARNIDLIGWLSLVLLIAALWVWKG